MSCGDFLLVTISVAERCVSCLFVQVLHRFRAIVMFTVCYLFDLHLHGMFAKRVFANFPFVVMCA